MQPVLYILHAKEDEKHEQALSRQLAVFEKIKKAIRVIRDRDFDAGSAVMESRQQAVDQAHIVVLLITPSFWNDYDLALRALAQKKRVIPVLVSDTPWTEVEVGGFRPLPSDGRFILEKPLPQDAAWLDVAQGLMRVWQSLPQAASLPAPAAPAAATAAPELPPLPSRPPLRPLLAGEKARILFVAANPSATSRLQLGEEYYQIKERLLRTPFAARIELIFEPELRLNQLAAALMRHRPHIVHFSGHGSADGAILMVDPAQAGGSRALDPIALRQLFHILNDGVHCVVLNACYSAANPQQAQALADVVGCVIGMEAGIADSSAVEFSASFYEALGFCRGLSDAFLLGKQAILAMNHPGPNVPQLYSKGEVNLSQFLAGAQASAS